MIRFLLVVVTILDFSAPSHADPPLGAKVERALYEALGDDPQALIGKKLRLVVISHHIPQAVVIPDGTIRLSSAIVDAATSDLALQFVIAHEAAHLALGHHGAQHLKGTTCSLTKELTADGLAIAWLGTGANEAARELFEHLADKFGDRGPVAKSLLQRAKALGKGP